MRADARAAAASSAERAAVSPQQAVDDLSKHRKRRETFRVGLSKRAHRRETRLFFEQFAEQFNADPLLRPFFDHIVAFGPKPIDTNLLAIDPSIDCPDAFLFGSQFRRYYRTFIAQTANFYCDNSI